MAHLTTQRENSKLQLPAYVGQRSATFRFDIVDSVTGYRRAVKPLSGAAPTLKHNTSATITRTITDVQLTPTDAALFNSITSRLEPFMIVGGETFSLGRYVPSDWARRRFSSHTSAKIGVASFYDEMFIIDQQLSNAFGAQSVGGEVIFNMLTRFLNRFPIKFTVEPSNFLSLGSWSAGTRGGVITEQLALDGDYLSPWFDHTSTLRFIRSFDPADELPTFDFDNHFHVLRENIIESDNLIDAPNRFVVVGNGAGAVGGVDVVGFADVPSTAPHSIANRGFIVADVQNRQVDSSAQAGAIAQNLVHRQTLIEQVELETLPDPRHDSYDIIHWQSENWLEIAWSLPLAAGGRMSHTLRKTYKI